MENVAYVFNIENNISKKEGEEAVCQTLRIFS